MKNRSVWLGGAFLILLAGAGAVALMTGGGKPAETPSLVQEKTRDATRSTKRTHAADKGREKTRHSLNIPLVSRPVGTGRLLDLTDEQTVRFLAESHRSPESLLTVFRIKGDLAMLREAANGFPQDAMVQLELAMRGDSPEEKRKALDAFRKLRPGDAVGDYLSAQLGFQQGQTVEAFKELAQAANHSGFGEGNEALLQVSEDAYLSAGHGLTEAKCAAVLGQTRTLTMNLNQLVSTLTGLYPQYVQGGDETSAQSVLQMGLSLSHRLRARSRLLIDDLMGISMESRLLGLLPPEKIVPGTAQTAGKRLEELNAEKLEISGLAKESPEILATMSENEVLSYMKRVGRDGELSALRWLRDNSNR